MQQKNDHCMGNGSVLTNLCDSHKATPTKNLISRPEFSEFDEGELFITIIEYLNIIQ